METEPTGRSPVERRCRSAADLIARRRALPAVQPDDQRQGVDAVLTPDESVVAVHDLRADE